MKKHTFQGVFCDALFFCNDGRAGFFQAKSMEIKSLIGE